MSIVHSAVRVAATACLVSSVCTGPAVATTSIHMRFGDALYNVDKQGEGLIDAAGARPYADTRESNGLASVDHGVIRLEANAVGSAGANVEGSFDDFFTIADPAIARGTRGVASFQMGVTGTLSSVRQPNNSGGGQASFKLNVEVNNLSTGILLEGIQFAVGNYVGDPLGTYTGSFSFRFGIEQRLGVTAICFAGASSGFSGDGRSSCDLGNTITWGGITSIVPEGGLVLSDVSLSSTSGANYLDNLAPVPEPGAWVLLLVGLGALCPWRRSAAPGGRGKAALVPG